MVRDISGLGSPPNTETRTAGNNAKATENTTADTSSADKSVNRDNVELSSEVKSLQTLTDKVSDLPEVNESRVAEIKAALERNELNIDNQRLADKILAADDLFNE